MDSLAVDLALDPWRIEAGLPTAWERMIAETTAEVLGAQWFEPTPGGTVTAYEGLAAWLPTPGPPSPAVVQGETR